MSISVSNVVVTTDTFESWIDTTNQLCDAMTTRVVTAEANTTGGVTTGNAHVNGYFSANTLIAKDGLRGGTVAAPANLTITSNASIVGSNAYISSNVYINTGNTWVNTSMFTIQGGDVHATSNVLIDGANTVVISPNVATVGANVLLVTSNTVVSGANVVLSVANLSVTSGKLNVSSNVEVTGLTTLAGNVSMTGSLQTISGNVNFDTGTVFIDAITNRTGFNTTTPDATLHVVGTANVSSNVRIGGQTTLIGNTVFTGTLQTIAGNVNFDTGTLFVDATNDRVGMGTNVPDATLAVAGTANVTGATRFANTVTVVGATTLSNTGLFVGAVSLSNTISVTGNATFSNTVNITGTTTVTSNVSLSGALHTVAGNAAFDATSLFVDSVNHRVGVKTITPDAALQVVGTANVSGNAKFSSAVTVVGNTVIGANVLYVSTETANTRVGINSDVAPYALVNYSLNVGGNTIVKDGNLVLSNGYVQTNQLKINNAGGLQLGENVALTFAGSIVGDVLPAYTTGTLSVNTTTGNNVIVLTTGSTSNLAVNYTVVEPGVLTSNTVIESIINSTAFTVSSAPLTTNNAVVIDYYSRYTAGALASYALGSLLDVNKRWEVYSKSIVNNNDLTTGGTLTVSNTTTTHNISGNVIFDAGSLFVDSVNNRVGINNTAPAQSLVVTGTANVSSNTDIGGSLYVSGRATVAGNTYNQGNTLIGTNTLFVNVPSARVGVNTITPGASLDVVGTANVSASVSFGNTLFVAGNTNIGSGNAVIRTDGTVVVSKSIKFANSGMYSNVATITTAAANTTIDQFAVSEFGTAKYVIDYRSTSNTQIFGAVETLVISNGTDIYMTEYAAVYSANISFSLDSAIATGTCSLYASAAQGNLSINVTRISMV